MRGNKKKQALRAEVETSSQSAKCHPVTNGKGPSGNKATNGNIINTPKQCETLTAASIMPSNGNVKESKLSKRTVHKHNGICCNGQLMDEGKPNEQEPPSNAHINGPSTFVPSGNKCNGNNGILSNSEQSKDVTQSSSLAEGQNDGEDGNFFTRHSHWLVFVFTIVFRVCYVSNSKNWWILHPDEVFQTVEVAHTLNYGYGFRPYEYTLPPSNLSLESPYRLQEYRLGMFSLRSFMLPRVISLAMWIADAIVPGTSPYRAAKVFHASVTSLLPLAVFYFTQTLKFSTNVASVASIMTSCSVSLSMFGTHALVNSFLSPFVFLSCIPLIRRISHTRSRLRREYAKVDHCNGVIPKDKTSNSVYFQTKEGTSNQNGDIQERHFQNGHTQNGHIQNGHFQKGHVKNGHVQEKSVKNGHLQNGQVQSSHNHNGHLGNDCVVKNGNSKTAKRYSSQKHTNGSAIPDVPRNYLLGESIQQSSAQNLKIHVDERFGVLAEFTAGLVLALIVYIRIDIIFIPALLGLLLGTDFRRKFQILKILFDLHAYILGFVLGILIGGYVDHVTYGVWFIAPYQWLHFNVFTNNASDMFGSMPAIYYLNRIISLDFLHSALICVFMLDFVLSFDISRRYLGCHVTAAVKEEKYTVALVTFAGMILFYSLNLHKELRFIHNCYVFMYILFARAIVQMNSLLIKSAGYFNNFTSLYTVLFLSVFVSNQIYTFSSMQTDDLESWANSKYRNTSHLNRCLDFLHGKRDVTGVFLDGSIQPSYSILGHDVAILFSNDAEFLEYDRPSRQELLDSRAYPGNVSHYKYTLFGEIRDFISIHNTPYLLRVLIEKKQYNYLVMDIDRQFIDIGYKEIYRSGFYKVLKRTFTKKSESSLKEMAAKVPFGSNAKVLEFEGRWLIHYGLYETAMQKLLLSNKIDPFRVGPYQLLTHIYKKLKQAEVSDQVMQQCITVISRKECLKKYQPITL